MNDLLYPALQKFYSSLKHLSDFKNENNFFDNISSLDSFFSEYRNITFVLQKSLAHTDYLSKYEEARNKYLTKCKWFIDKRNETTKQQPFDLVKDIDIYAYLPYQELSITSQSFRIDNDIPLPLFIDSCKEFFIQISKFEIFFSVKFDFHEPDNDENIFKTIAYGINQMYNLIRDMILAINQKNDICDSLLKKINELIISVTNDDFLSIIDYVYYPTKDEFERASRISLILGKQSLIKLSVKTLSMKIPDTIAKDTFEKFIYLHVIMGNVNLMPVLVKVYDDDTIDMDVFQSDIKTTYYRKINEAAKSIAASNIKEIYYMNPYTSCPYSEENLNNTSAQRQTLSTLDILVFSKIDKYLESYEVSFEDKKISDPQYIAYQLNNIEKGLNLSNFNMQPIIKAFKEKHSF